MLVSFLTKFDKTEPLVGRGFAETNTQITSFVSFISFYVQYSTGDDREIETVADGARHKSTNCNHGSAK